MSRERDSGDRERDRRESRETERSGEREPNPGARTGRPVSLGSSDPPSSAAGAEIRRWRSSGGTQGLESTTS
jgi:hypothetical protein